MENEISMAWWLGGWSIAFAVSFLFGYVTYYQGPTHDTIWLQTYRQVGNSRHLFSKNAGPILEIGLAGISFLSLMFASIYVGEETIRALVASKAWLTAIFIGWGLAGGWLVFWSFSGGPLGTLERYYDDVLGKPLYTSTLTKREKKWYGFLFRVKRLADKDSVDLKKLRLNYQNYNVFTVISACGGLVMLGLLIGQVVVEFDRAEGLVEAAMKLSLEAWHENTIPQLELLLLYITEYNLAIIRAISHCLVGTAILVIAAWWVCGTKFLMVFLGKPKQIFKWISRFLLVLVAPTFLLWGSFRVNAANEKGQEVLQHLTLQLAENPETITPEVARSIGTYKALREEYTAKISGGDYWKLIFSSFGGSIVLFQLIVSMVKHRRVFGSLFHDEELYETLEIFAPVEDEKKDPAARRMSSSLKAGINRNHR